MDPNSKNWWSTLPGVITAIAGTLTAITGLIIALDQIGFFKSHPNRLPTSQQQQSSTDSTTTKSEVVKKEDAGNGSPKEITIDKKRVHLSSGSNKIRLDILRATLESYDPQNSLLTFRFRIFDESGWGHYMRDGYFILLIDDIPTATINESSVSVDPHAAAETTAAFKVPLHTKNVVLKIYFLDSSVTIPVSLNN